MPIASGGYVQVTREFYIQIDIQPSSPQLVVVIGNPGPTNVTLSGITVNEEFVFNIPKILPSNENITLSVPRISEVIGDSDVVTVGFEFAHSFLGYGPAYRATHYGFNGTFHEASMVDMSVPKEVPAPDVPITISPTQNACVLVFAPLGWPSSV